MQLSNELEGFITLVTAIIAVPILIAAVKRYRRDNAVLAEVAERRNGKLTRAERMRHQLEIESGAIRIQVSGNGELFKTRMRWIADLPEPGTVPFRVTPIFPRPVAHGRQPGAIEAKDIESVWRVWLPEVDAVMHRLFKHGEFTSSGRGLTIKLSMSRPDVETVDAGIDLLLRVGTADLYGLAALRGLADAQDRPSPDGLPGVVIDGPVPIWIGVERAGGLARTRADAQGVEAMTPGTAEIVDGLPADADAVARLPESATPHLGAVGSATISWDAEKTSIRWKTIQDDAQSLAAAVAFLRAMTAPPSMGVFR